ncbi:MAG: hypothetical protein FJW29_12330 [Acidobacteria bacterium]|nr:hypothetical protein [Acidobacteriota bacterium]
MPDPNASTPNAEQVDRALATVIMSSAAVPSEGGRCDVQTRARITNLGEYSFVLVDLAVTMSTHGTLEAAWAQNSLLGADEHPLSLGLPPLALAPETRSDRARFAMDTARQTWHLMEPGRTADVTFIQPVTGIGRLATVVDLAAQPVEFERLSTLTSVLSQFRGRTWSAMPEWGEGILSELTVFPYQASEILTVPGDCRSASTGQ